jgi:phosphatidylethanolamine-binding protein (PEBP) family uncharacterized protein
VPANPLGVALRNRRAGQQTLALDQAPALPAGATLAQVIAAIAGHVIGRARLDGTYEIR